MTANKQISSLSDPNPSPHFVIWAQLLFDTDVIHICRCNWYSSFTLSNENACAHYHQNHRAKSYCFAFNAKKAELTKKEFNDINQISRKQKIKRKTEMNSHFLVWKNYSIYITANSYDQVLDNTLLFTDCKCF